MLQLQLTDQAKLELQNRLSSSSKPYIRLQMRHSCFMKLKLTIEDAVQINDVVVALDGFDFIVDKTQIHYFQNGKLDFIADHTGFKQFEITA
ncbi:iron-sulfur cluster biosynthesis family protein [Ferviditalea candida]|uniref:Iron-sulfur cluster biosynthesis family protein n=1 Tax=Ferviditalea candida TaxID=3108399 RepID=A0ABU5ZDC2_9BACL|nr:iron-sulfur cluster biosynthesis family protein [Paenibacillaceae bacterium T2]